MAMDFNKFFQSKEFKLALLGIAGFIAILLVFSAGTFVGFMKARFSYQWGENYHKNFAGPRGGFFEDFVGRDFIDAHGVFGQVIKIDPSAGSGQVPSSLDSSSGQGTLVIKGRGDVEKIILVADSTVIKRFQDNIKLSDLKVDDYIVVIGDPNNAGQIEAKLIRIMPPPPSSTFSGGPFPFPLPR
jgi:hypothetical protein